MFDLRHARCWAVAALAAAVAILSGCATTLAVDPAKQAPKANESVVVVTITSNTAQMTAIDTLTVRRSHEDDNFVLQRIAPGLARDTSLFVGVMPAGDYDFLQFDNFDKHLYLAISTGMREHLGHFHVVAGQATDLGRVIMTQVNSHVMLGRSTLVTDNVALMTNFAPQELQFFQGKTSTGWITPRSATDRVEEYAQQCPVGADGLVELPDGRLAAGSRLGNVLVREKDGRWRAIRSGVLHSVLSVMPVDRQDAVLIAVGEFDTILRLPRWDGGMEVVDPGNLPPGSLVFIDGNDHDGWYVGLQQENDLQLLHSARLDHGDWTSVAHDPMPKNTFFGGNQAWFWRLPGGLAYAMTSGRIRRLDYASGRWTESHAPNNDNLGKITLNPDGSLAILTSPGGGFGGVLASLYLSTDFGATWTKVESDFNVSMNPPFRTRKGTLLVPGGVFGKQEIHASTDGGKTWQARGEFPVFRQLLTTPTQGLLGIEAGLYGRNFGIWHSADEGASWTLEYSNFDRVAYDLEHQNK